MYVDKRFGNTNVGIGRTRPRAGILPYASMVRPIGLGAVNTHHDFFDASPQAGQLPPTHGVDVRYQYGASFIRREWIFGIKEPSQS